MQGVSAEQNVLSELIMAERDRLRENHAEWFFDYEDFDPMTAPREVCEALLVSAPTEWARGMIAGIMVMRSQLAMITGRGF